MTQKITTFLTYKEKAEEAAALYTSVFADSRIVSTMKGPDGTVMGVEFELAGQRYNALNGGPSFSFCEGVSLSVSCDTQKEIDEYTAKLIAGGGEQGPCGWIKDRFGVSWQIVPAVLGKLIGDSAHPDKAGRAMQAMLKMKKLDIAALERAHAGEDAPAGTRA
jgi:predicted 3-demethylubiquinone-9 3-methyltransferase (glyoxalase superfamily)